MTGRFGRGAALTEMALWVLAGLLVLTAHVGAAAWLLRAPPVIPADDMPPAAIMISVADAPEALATEETEISPDEQTAEASTPVEKVETPQETPSEETIPEEEVAEAEPDQEVVEEELPVHAQVAVPLPVAKPPPPDKKRQAAKPKPRKKKSKPRPREEAQISSRQAVQAQAQVRQSNRNAARQTASGLFSSMTPATWQSRLMAHLERRKKYPAGSRARGERGTVYVRFTIDGAGNVRSVRLVRSSGFPDLDREVLALVHRASPVPAPPQGAKRTITAPVRFRPR